MTLVRQQVTQLDRRLTPFAEQLLTLMRVPGLAIGVIAEGEVVYARGFGVAGLDDLRPVTERTLFHMASVTKPFVATAVMQLVEEGRVELDASVVTYLPYFKLADDREGDVTVRQMLTHTSAMPDTDDYGWDKPEYDDEALERYVRSLTEYSLMGEPGQEFAYSNIAFEVLGDLIAKVSGRSFEEQLRERILSPLGMRDSMLMVTNADQELVSRGHTINAAGEVHVSEIFPYNRAHGPSSTLISNIEDMCRWAQANLNGGELDGQRFLSRDRLDAMWQPVMRCNMDEPRQVCLTWYINAYRGHRTIGHSGADTGFQSNLVLLPDHGIAAVAMCNVDIIWDAPWYATNAALEILLGPAR